MHTYINRWVTEWNGKQGKELWEDPCELLKEPTAFHFHILLNWVPAVASGSCLNVFFLSEHMAVLVKAWTTVEATPSTQEKWGSRNSGWLESLLVGAVRLFLVLCESLLSPALVHIWLDQGLSGPGPCWGGSCSPVSPETVLQLDEKTQESEVTCGLSLIKPEKDPTPKGWLTNKKGAMSERESGSWLIYGLCPQCA